MRMCMSDRRARELMSCLRNMLMETRPRCIILFLIPYQVNTCQIHSALTRIARGGFRLLAEASTSARLTCLSWMSAVSLTRPRSAAQHDTHQKAARSNGGSAQPGRVQAEKASQAEKAPSCATEAPKQKKATVMPEAITAKAIKAAAVATVAEVSKPQPLKPSGKVTSRRQDLDPSGSTVEQTHSAGTHLIFAILPSHLCTIVVPTK